MSLDQLSQAFRDVPHTGIASNVPYASRPGVVEDTEKREAARGAFFDSPGQQWPDLEYPQLDDPSLDASERKYTRLLNDIIHEDDSEAANGLYESVARKLAEVYRHMEVRRRLGGLATPELTELSRQRAALMSEELFGSVDHEKFQIMLGRDIGAARAALTGARGTARAIVAREFLTLLNISSERAGQLADAAEHATAPPELTRSTLDIINGDLHELFPGLAAMSRFGDRGEHTPASEAKPAFLAALDVFGLREKGWDVLVQPNGRGVETLNRSRRITYGERRAPFSGSSIIRVPLHEAIHALRYQNGQEQPDPARWSLPGTVAFDEGLAVGIEQILSGEIRTPGEKYYMQLGLLEGLHLPEAERRPQTYRQVEEIMWRRAALREPGELTEDKLARMPLAAYKSVMRTTRGNARDNRDISYFVGAQPAVAFLNETAQLDKPTRHARLLWVLSGLFDPTNAEQAAVYGGDPAYKIERG